MQNATLSYTLYHKLLHSVCLVGVFATNLFDMCEDQITFQGQSYAQLTTLTAD